MMISDVIDLFLQRAAAQPSHPAVITDELTCDYSALENCVRRFAAIFAGRLAPKIIIALPQGPYAYAAMFAAGLAGGFYTALNLVSPNEKLGRIVKMVEPDFIVGERGLTAQFAKDAPNAIAVDPADLGRSELFAGRRSRHELAYVIFTSGSTGVPKGVMIPRVALDHYIGWTRHSLQITPQDRLSQHPNIAFDVSVMDIYGALCSGATLYPLVSPGDRLRPAGFIERHRLTVWISVPSVVSLMMQASEVTNAKLNSLRRLVFCGEPLLREHLDALFAACPDTVVENSYGPTETTVTMTSLPLRANHYADACGTFVAIGDPIPNTGVYLIGGPHDDEGEIVITGPQVAVGYWGDPERTAQSFKMIDVDGQPVRAYFSGDWAERRGPFMFFKERMDFQVKIHGYRIELNEIAGAIREAGWPIVCVFKRKETLVAYIERHPGQEFDQAALHAALAQRLEPYAIPAYIRTVECIPRTENDKLDRGAVMSLFEAEIGPLEAEAATRTRRPAAEAKSP
jgi:D-alanine--poly(phosphoribitol) ligase subunit 1